MTLAGRFPHDVLDEIFAATDALADEAAIRKKAAYFGAKVQQELDSFAASIPAHLQKLPPDAPERALLRRGQPWRDAFADALLTPQEDDEAKGAFPDVDNTGEVVKLLLVHDRPAALLALAAEVDLGRLWRAGYSNFFNGGLGHIVADNVQFISVLNQLLRNPVVQGDPSRLTALHDAIPRGERVRALIQQKPRKRGFYRLAYQAQFVVRELGSVYDYRTNREGSNALEFAAALADGSWSAEQVVEYCKSLWRQLYQLQAAFDVSAKTFGTERRKVETVAQEFFLFACNLD